LAKAGSVLRAAAKGRFDAAPLRGMPAELCCAQRQGRGAAHEVALFKSVGTALEDLAPAELESDSRAQGRFRRDAV